MITREEAFEIAESALRERPEVFTHELYQMKALEEIKGRKPCIYNGPSLEFCWIAYLRLKEIRGLVSSTIMLISRQTGEIVYFGSANDEG